MPRKISHCQSNCVAQRTQRGVFPHHHYHAKLYSTTIPDVLTAHIYRDRSCAVLGNCTRSKLDEQHCCIRHLGLKVLFKLIVHQPVQSAYFVRPHNGRFYPLSQFHCPRCGKRSRSDKVAHNCPSLGPPHPYRFSFIRNTHPPSLFHSRHFPYSLYSSGGLHSCE
jgi:hypothetical protein